MFILKSHIISFRAEDPGSSPVRIKRISFYYTLFTSLFENTMYDIIKFLFVTVFSNGRCMLMNQLALSIIEILGVVLVVDLRHAT